MRKSRLQQKSSLQHRAPGKPIASFWDVLIQLWVTSGGVPGSHRHPSYLGMVHGSYILNQKTEQVFLSTMKRHQTFIWISILLVLHCCTPRDTGNNCEKEIPVCGKEDLWGHCGDKICCAKALCHLRAARVTVEQEDTHRAWLGGSSWACRCGLAAEKAHVIWEMPHLGMMKG